MKKMPIWLFSALLLGLAFVFTVEAGMPAKGQPPEVLSDEDDNVQLEGLIMENDVYTLVVNERTIYIDEKTRLEDSQKRPVDILAMKAMKRVRVEGTAGAEKSVNATLIRLLDR